MESTKIIKYVTIIITIFLSINFGIDRIYAEPTCFYMDEDDAGTTAIIVKYWWKSDQVLGVQSGCSDCAGDYTTVYEYSGDITVEKYRNSIDYEAGLVNRGQGQYTSCPKKIVAYSTSGIGGKYVGIYARIDANEVDNYKTDIPNPIDSIYLKNVTIEKYFGVECPNCVLGENVNINCIAGSAKTSLFGDPNYGGTKYTSGDYEGIYETPPSMAYMINKILNIMRIATIVIVMTLGTIDIVKTVIASQEDEMKKAQKAFVKRIIACVVVFLVPILINVVFKISYNMWREKGFHSCTLEQINDTCAQYTTSSECFSHGCHYTNNKCVPE